jgi:hypothetical protein
VRVLPEPVGARISACSPAAMAGHPCSWACVGAGNDDSNQARTGSENRSSAAMPEAYGDRVTTSVRNPARSYDRIRAEMRGTAAPDGARWCEQEVRR